jgi:serine phosphatase RsbU (regulator of sigma subunit)/CheY-like chemotaxis protein
VEPLDSTPMAGGEDTGDLTAVDDLPILIVDDRQENLNALEAVLSPLGYQLLAARSGADALRLLLEHDVALILLDVRMPDLDGLETARLIKGRARTRDVPIVFLTAARDEVGDILRGYGVGAVDYVLKPFEPDLLRSKVAVFVELEKGRRAVKRSEAFLRAAFEGAPIGKAIVAGDRAIVRANSAFARLVGRDPAELEGAEVLELCHPDDRERLSAALDRVVDGDSGEGLSAALDRVVGGNPEPSSLDREGVDLRLHNSDGSEVWVTLVASSIEPTDPGEPLLLIQWVDLSARRRAEEARAELLLEHAARNHAEAMAERLSKLQALSGAIESLSLHQVLAELAVRLAELFDVQIAEIELARDSAEPIVIRAEHGEASQLAHDERRPEPHQSLKAPIVIEGATVGELRLGRPAGLFSAAERSLLRDAAERAALGIRRARLHEREHRVAIELQRGLLPKRLPEIAGVQLTAHYEAAGAEVGGDWYDAFALPAGRLGVVLGDVAGRGVSAASAMGQLRSVTRAFSLADEGVRLPGEVLTRLNRHQLALGQTEMFTVVYVIIDAPQGIVSWACAGHPPPLLRNREGGTTFLEGGEGLMGIEDVVYKDLRAPIGPGEVLVCYTDGLVERRGESLDVGLRRLADAVAGGPDEPEALREHVLAGVRPAQTELDDDVTALFVKLE